MEISSKKTFSHHLMGCCPESNIGERRQLESEMLADRDRSPPDVPKKAIETEDKH